MSCVTESTSRDVLTFPLVRREPEVAAISVPARAYTGDFYLVRRDSTGRLWFILGDVAGKGIDAAVYMAMLQETIELSIDCASLAYGPRDLVSELQTALCPELPTNRFVSMIVGTVRSDGVADIVNAGHCPVFIADRAGNIREIASTGPVVGILPGARWTSRREYLATGSVLVAYSDGINESESPEGEEFSTEGVAAVVADVRSGTAEEIAGALLDAAARHRGGRPQHDDTTALVIRS